MNTRIPVSGVLLCRLLGCTPTPTLPGPPVPAAACPRCRRTT